MNPGRISLTIVDEVEVPLGVCVIMYLKECPPITTLFLGGGETL